MYLIINSVLSRHFCQYRYSFYSVYLVHYSWKFRSLNYSQCTVLVQVTTFRSFLCAQRLIKIESKRPIFYLKDIVICLSKYLADIYHYIKEWRKNPKWSLFCCLALLLPLNQLQVEVQWYVLWNKMTRTLAVIQTLPQCKETSNAIVNPIHSILFFLKGVPTQHSQRELIGDTLRKARNIPPCILWPDSTVRQCFFV